MSVTTSGMKKNRNVSGNTDDLKPSAFRFDRLPDDIRTASELALPETVAQDNDCVVAVVIRLHHSPADRGPDAGDVEEISRDFEGANHVGAIAAAECDVREVKGRQAGQRSILPAQIEEGRTRYDVANLARDAIGAPNDNRV